MTESSHIGNIQKENIMLSFIGNSLAVSKAEGSSAAGVIPDSVSSSASIGSSNSKRRSKRRRRSSRSGKNLNSKTNTVFSLEKSDDSERCNRWFPVVFEPFVRAHTLSVAVAFDILITLHRNGVRLHRQAAIGATETGTYELVESRIGDADYKDTYMLCTTDPVIDEDHYVLTKYARYFGVASGSDRSTHSVSVSSVASHFTLHHELHGTQRVAAMHFAMLCLNPINTAACTPILCSIDEVGQIVLFDIERNVAARVEFLNDAACGGTKSKELSTLLNASSEEMRLAEKESALVTFLEGNAHLMEPFQYRAGLATQVALSGPCVEVCPHCHNFFSPSATREDAQTFFVGLTVAICARGQDVSAAGQRSCGGSITAGDEANRNDNASCIKNKAAKLHISFVRIIWSTKGKAYALWEKEVCSTVAKECVCDAGVTLCAQRYVIGEPQTIWTGGASSGTLSSWSACTAELFCSSPPVLPGEVAVLSCMPLGWHVLSGKPVPPQGSAQATDGDKDVWDMFALMTSRGELLLVGRRPDGHTIDVKCPPSEWRAEQQIAADERAVLENWLDDVEPPSSPFPSPSKKVGDHKPPQDDKDDRHSAGKFVLLATLMSFLSSDDSLCDGLAVRYDYRTAKLMVFSLHDDTLVSVSLPFTSPLLPPKEDPPGGVLHETETSLLPDTQLWQHTTTAVSQLMTGWGTVGSLLPSRGASAASASATAEPSGVPQPVLQPSTRPQERSSGLFGAFSGYGAYNISIVRPLASALSHWTTSTTDAPTRADSSARAAVEPAASLPSPSPAESRERQSRESEEKHLYYPYSNATHTDSTNPSSSSSASATKTNVAAAAAAATAAAAVNTLPGRSATTVHSVMSSSPQHSQGDGDGDEDGHVRRRKRHAHSRRSAGTSSPSSCGSWGSRAERRSTAPKRYIDGILSSLLDSRHCSPDPVSGNGFLLTTTLSQLIELEEPAARNEIIFQWKDMADALVFGALAERDRLDEERRVNAIQEVQRCVEYAAIHVHDLVRDISKGKFASEAFMENFESIRHSRIQTRSQLGVFDFHTYFTQGTIPQKLIDMQERDRCQYEVEDLRIRHDAALQLLNPFEVVTIYQNEEKRVDLASGKAQWHPQSTVPFEDVGGHPVNLSDWNLTAGPDAPKKWRWDTEEESDWAAEKQMDINRKVKKTVQASRKLRQWTVDEWKYAPSWPVDNSNWGSAYWCEADNPTMQVRRRALMRRRVNIKIKAERDALMEKQMDEMTQLRDELRI